MSNKMKTLNSLSAVAFVISSLSLLMIPFIEIGDDLPKEAYAIAAFFWVGFLVGAVIQLYLLLECKKMKLKNKYTAHRIPLLISAVSFIILLMLIILKSSSKLAVIISLFMTILSLQLSAVIKRKGCLK
ncbi:MAG: hypothetical protein K2J26_05760 [Ruminococcus sp.]|nr:hypothetical protein [Ruminococcus sp.]